MRRHHWIAAAAVLVSAACGASRGNDGGSASTSNSSVITPSELRTVSATNLYDAVERLRPQWFRRFRSSPISGPQTYQVVVYLDRSRLGGIDVLKQLRPFDVASIKYFSPSEAEAEFGLGHLNGAIQVVTVRP